MRTTVTWKRLASACALVGAIVAIPARSDAASVLFVDSHNRLGSLIGFWAGFGDSVTVLPNWASTPASLSSYDIVWDGGHFNNEGPAAADKVVDFVNGDGGFFGQTERPCCDPHNAWLQGIFRTLTGDNALTFGGAGDGNGGTGQFLFPDTSILIEPNDIRGTLFNISAPGQIVVSDESKIFARQQGVGGFTIGVAYAESDLVNNAGRIATISDIDWLDSINSDEARALGNIREFLLRGRSLPPGCGEDPSLPGCQPPVPEPHTFMLLAGAALFAVRRMRRR